MEAKVEGITRIETPLGIMDGTTSASMISLEEVQVMNWKRGDGWTDRQAERHTGRKTARQKDGRTARREERRTDGRAEGRTEGLTDKGKFIEICFKTEDQKIKNENNRI